MTRKNGFQSTRPVRGETMPTKPVWSAVMSFQSTRPVRGETKRVFSPCKADKNFNPLAPCGARRVTRTKMSPITNFNPLAPCGARHNSLKDRGGAHIFQSTRPVRGETSAVSPCTILHGLFQSTRPVRGETQVLQQIGQSVIISIHSPRAGRDYLSIAFINFKPYFNPLAPCGARPLSSILSVAEPEFQSTRPVRGETFRKLFIYVCAHDFNPLAPCGARPSGRVNRLSTFIFQSTRPVRGETLRRGSG